MAVDYSSHLATAILNDGKVVSYRMLSRELKVHNNSAKRMLFEFHRRQNAKKASSIHATYLINGLQDLVLESQVNGDRPNEEDAPMQSSPFMSSSAPQGSAEEEKQVTRHVAIVREEELEEAKAKFAEISSIHVYSLEPQSLQNLQILSECNRIVATEFYNEDPLVVGNQYGVIHNQYVRRRTARRPPGVAPALTSAKTPMVLSKSSSTTQSRPSSAGTEAKRDQSKTEKPASKPAPLRREQSDIFKSFSKSKPQSKAEPKVEPEEGKTPREPVTTKLLIAAVTMKDASDNDDDVVEDEGLIGANKSDANAISALKERAEKNRRMMEDDDDEEAEEDLPTKEAEEEKEASEAPEFVMVDKPEPEKEPSPEPAIAVSGGRRRGRRKVMKKKTVKDEEGYLVTREEPAWESFSEEEPPAKREIQSSSSGTGKKKSSGKPGQGNIMSFFGKK